MKKKITVVAAIMLCASIAVGGSVAYFTHEESTTGEISTAGLEITLEKWAEAEDGSLVETGDSDEIVPGSEVSKVVWVTNTGKRDTWVRVSVEESITLVDGGEGDLALMSLDLNTEDWTELDGYYYYLSVLEPGQETEPLFTTVSFSEEMDNVYQNSTASIDIDAQATQVANNGETVWDAAGWPSEE
jgi:hypothetical protein